MLLKLIVQITQLPFPVESPFSVVHVYVTMLLCCLSNNLPTEGHYQGHRREPSVDAYYITFCEIGTTFQTLSFGFHLTVAGLV